MLLLNCQSHAFNNTASLWNNPPPVIDRQHRNRRLHSDPELFYSDFNTSIAVDPFCYKTLLQKFTKERYLAGGLQLHALIFKGGLHCVPPLQTRLLSLYFKCQSLEFARRVFYSGSARNDSIISWNTMITLYSQLGYAEEALLLFFELLEWGHEPDEFTFSHVITLIAQQNELILGRQLHSLAIRSGYGGEEFVVNSLVNMYAACGRIDDSISSFNENSSGFSSMAWNSMIGKLAEHGHSVDSFRLFKQMLIAGIKPTALTFSSLLPCSAEIKSHSLVQQLHSQVIVHGFSSNEITGTALMDAYLKCGQLERGKNIFNRIQHRTVFTWNSIIRGYSELGFSEESFKLFQTMRKEGTSPNRFTYSALLAGTSFSTNNYEELKRLHAHIIKDGMENDCFVGTSIINMYSAINDLEDARIAFDYIHPKDIVSWSSIISACTKAEEGEEALELFIMMINSGFETSQLIYSSLLTACSLISKMEAGKQIHAHSLKSRDSLDIATINTLIAMYSNCGCLQEARRAFISLENPNTISFNSMISALAQYGCPKEAADMFDQMKLSGLRPDGISVLNLLSAYNHAGLVQEGLELFNTMQEIQGVKPTYQHYACIVDLLSRAGRLEEAVNFIKDMPFEPNSELWRTVLGACIKHRNLNLGKEIAKILLKQEPYEASNYVLFANIYARLGRWTEAEYIRHLMKNKGIVKEVGISWIEINRTIHKFGVEDRSHLMSEIIYQRLLELIRMIKAKGYVPDISFTLHDIDDVRREESLYYHSEKLAFACGDLIASKGVVLRIMKNLRVCGDCHSAYKYFTVITGREIMLRDNYRFHHFKNGSCSCGDYW